MKHSTEMSRNDFWSGYFLDIFSQTEVHFAEIWDDMIQGQRISIRIPIDKVYIARGVLGVHLYCVRR